MLISLEGIQKCLAKLKRDKGSRQPWAAEIVDQVTVERIDTTATCPSIEYKIKVQDWMLNINRVMHGGCVATIVDNLVTWSSIADPKLWERCNDIYELYRIHGLEMGKLRNLSISYLRPIPQNSTVVLIAKIHSRTKRSIVLTFKIIDPITKKEYVVGVHDQAKRSFVPSNL